MLAQSSLLSNQQQEGRDEGRGTTRWRLLGKRILILLFLNVSVNWYLARLCFAYLNQDE